MKIQFKQPRSIDGKDYVKGTHEVPDSKSDHWYLKGLIKSGVAVMVQGPAEVELEVMKEKVAEDDEPKAEDEPKQTKKQTSKKGK